MCCGRERERWAVEMEVWCHKSWKIIHQREFWNLWRGSWCDVQRVFPWRCSVCWSELAITFSTFYLWKHIKQTPQTIQTDSVHPSELIQSTGYEDGEFNMKSQAKWNEYSPRVIMTMVWNWKLDSLILDLTQHFIFPELLSCSILLFAENVSNIP